MEVTIEATPGSGAPGCEETAEGCYIPSTATVVKNGFTTSASCTLISSNMPSDCMWEGTIQILEGDLISIKHITSADGNFDVSQVQAFVSISST